MDAARFFCVSTTLESKEAANAMAGTLVDLKHAACVQIFGPIQSIYRWKGKIEEAEEWLCLAKTDAAHLPEVKKTILATHAYEEPEIIATEIVDGSEGYFAWLRSQLG